MRTRIAVFPFRLYEIQSDKDRFQRILNQNINDYLVQTKKFTMLDRSFIDEIVKEQKSILDGKTPQLRWLKQEMKSQQILYQLVLEDFSIEEKVTKFVLGSRNKRNVASIYLSYRLLDVATKQIIIQILLNYKYQLRKVQKRLI